MYKIDDVVVVHHPFLRNRAWRILNITPSLKEGEWLFRVHLLEDAASGRVVIDIVEKQRITKYIGGYEEWLQQNKS
jgi:hypothetical protein